MSNRFDQSRQRNYSELCNRSSTGSSMVGHYPSARISYPTDTFEDYWEDASVSIRAFHSQEAPSTSMRPGTSESQALSAPASLSAPAAHEILPRRDSAEFTACPIRHRSFPPPLALCSTLSIKEGGRFVLKEMDADRPQGFFRVQRGNGRLRLHLVLTDEEDDDEEDDHVESCPAEMDSSESDAFGEEDDRSNGRDCSATDSNGSRSLPADDEVGLGGVSDENGRCERGGAVYDDDDDNPEAMVYSEASLTWQEVAMDARLKQLNDDSLTRILAGDGHHHISDTDRDARTCGKEPGVGGSHGFLTFPDAEPGQFASESSSSGGAQEPAWNVDVGDQAMASLSSPWKASQMCLQASPLASMRPPIGLAMS